MQDFGLGYSLQYSDDLVKYLKGKGYSDEILKESGLALYNEKYGMSDKFVNRVMFPIIDVRGNVIGFGGRIMNNNDPNAAKYLNSPETLIFNKRKNLFGLNVAKKTKLPYMILVEGYMDAIALHQYGFDCAVASLGTSLTEEHAALLTRYTDQVVLIYDGDEAGQRATRRAIPILEKAGLQVKVLKMKDAKDPDEFLKKFGADTFRIIEDEPERLVEIKGISKNKAQEIFKQFYEKKELRSAMIFLQQYGISMNLAVKIQQFYGQRMYEVINTNPYRLAEDIDGVGFKIIVNFY